VEELLGLLGMAHFFIIKIWGYSDERFSEDSGKIHAKRSLSDQGADPERFASGKENGS